MIPMRYNRGVIYYGLMIGLLIIVGVFQSWNLALNIFNLCLISAVMALGVNIQWGYAGLFNVGIMGFAALGGLAAVLVSFSPVKEAWHAGGTGVAIAAMVVVGTFLLVFLARKYIKRPLWRRIAIIALLVIGYFIARYFFDPSTKAIEKINPASTGFLGGLGLPILVSWLVGGIFAAGGAWIIGKIALGLRSDYLAIATLGISEIMIAILKNEDWLSRGVKNVIGLPRPVPYEIELQKNPGFIEYSNLLGADIVPFSSIVVKLCYAGLFGAVLLLVVYLSDKALNSPWGRMMRAIRDNEQAASAMGKDIVGRRLQVFVLGSMVVGIAGAMLTTLDGQLTPGSYNPLRYTFLIWVMVIVGGSGNNWGAVLGGFLIWFTWIEAEPVGLWLMKVMTSGFEHDSPIRQHLIENAAYMRFTTMGIILLVVLRYFPKGLIPER